MADIFRSAFGIFSGSKTDSDFVGQRVDIASTQLRVKKLIAEGERIHIVYISSFSWLLIVEILVLVFLPLKFAMNCVNMSFMLGAYGFVFVAQDVSSGKEYALKVNI